MFLRIFAAAILYLEQIGGPESAHPEEATLSRAHPHPCDEVEDVGLGRLGLEIEQLNVMGQGFIDYGSEFAILQVCVERPVQLSHAPAMLVQPPCVLHVEHCCVWTWTPQHIETSRHIDDEKIEKLNVST